MGENPEIIAMARRIVAAHYGLPGHEIRENCSEMAIALAAIIETQERDAALAETAYKGVTSGPRYIAGRFIAKMIRSGHHYGKDHPHA